ncbi:MAG: cobaltochelatase subunit CobN [Gemmatimonadota bacterium]|nr:cobaltochelatase subunit CobN [Gemmatimonadota bacterium]MDQ8147203.1 cobaltochelatase subunit CobN [Gemmatimonadota bacterium]MDQ8149045.1 cobaltochelatase subunit CobN [Gemmatimonadota bacterium]MDQ8156361.1 cobaltochelatase subunit CobN [Gemmatimonadota bacterium]MDQ8176606.1 cobaltochelatase subunit CobN [Gemmatimonadota bacterium]
MASKRAAVPVRVTILTLDAHFAEAFVGARRRLARELPGLTLTMHVAAEYADDAALVAAACADIAAADIIIAGQLFTEESAGPVKDAIAARRAHCDAVCAMLCVNEVVKSTRLGKYSMADEDRSTSAWSPMALLKKLRGERTEGRSAGERQLAALKRLPKLLRFIPGTAQDVRSWFLAMQYWLAGSEENLANLVRMLVNRYAAGPRATLRGALTVGEPVEYPEVGCYHPTLPGLGLTEDVRALPRAGKAGRVGVLLGRSYLLAGNTAHYDAVIRALEGQGLSVVPAFASGLDARAAITRYFMSDAGRGTGQPAATIDALVSLTGFSLVGGPAYNDADAAQAVLAALDVPYLSLQTLEFQSVAEWEQDPRGLNALQATLQVAIPEIDGAIGPLVYGGKGTAGSDGVSPSEPIPGRIALLATRVAKLARLRRTPRGERKVGIVLFNFPPNAGNTGSAAYLAVFESLFNVLHALRREGYDVDVPASVDALRTAVTEGNATLLGAPANVHARVSAESHVARTPHLAELEAVWGPAPGRQLTDGRDLFVLGAQFGQVFVGVQPAFGWEGDPMRLLFQGNFAPTHAFAAFYQWMREDFGADVVLHFGTHGALEFMPGKQVGLTDACWPDRLIGDLPNVYLYASNNSSEGTLAKRRGGATLVTYLTPPIAQAGLYKDLAALKASLDSARAAGAEDPQLIGLVQEQAAALDLCAAAPRWVGEATTEIAAVRSRLLELEYALIPLGLHVVGEGMPEAARADTIRAIQASMPEPMTDDEAAQLDRLLAEDHEIPGILRALDGRYLPPAPGGDLVRTPKVAPTGRNMYGFDPYKVPSAYALLDGRTRADALLSRHLADGHAYPETVAFVLWGTDNMKTEGAPIAQVLALMGAVPRFDAVGRLAGARLLPLETLGRPRIDVVCTLSGIFRDLLPLQVKLIAEAAWLAAQADEPEDRNFIRKHALAHQAALGCDLETAALRVFSNADGAYGSNVNLLVDTGQWESEDELAEQFVRRKSHAYGVRPGARPMPELMQRALGGADIAFQNLDSVELGATDIDQYVESLGGMNRVITRAKGCDVPVYLGDHTGKEGRVRTLGEQVALETRTRMLNPKWYEAQLAQGYEGARNIAGHVATTLGWSATAGQVPEWVYTDITTTFVLDPAMRDRLAQANANAAAGMAKRLMEAHDRGYWQPSEDVLAQLREASEELEDRLEGVYAVA